MPHIAVVVATILALAICVIFQYEALTMVWRWLSRHEGHRRVKVLYGIVSVIALHFAQICLFGATLWLMLLWPATGRLLGEATHSFLDCVYLSSITFSTVGYGDIAPLGPIRFLAGTEALSGFVLITWSASFTYLEMEKFWRAEDMKDDS